MCKIESTVYEEKVIIWGDFKEDTTVSNESYSIRQTDIILVQGDTEMNISLDNEGLFSTLKILSGGVVIYREKNINPLLPIQKGLIIE